jgi:putative ABC transport system ATP-binding protein
MTQAGSSPLIAFRNVERVYGIGEAEVRALAGVNFQISAGEFVAIMGPSGSGKSTAMNILGCLDQPTAGTYEFVGSDVSALDRDQRAMLRRHYLGFVFQGFNLLARTTALENVELPLIYRGMPRAERRDAAYSALAKVGLNGRENHVPSELSGGQQQRVAIARALVGSPQVILADEPTGNLDTHRSHEIMELLVQLNRDEGITIAMVTHEDAMAAYASRNIVFTDGLISYDGPSAGLTAVAPPEKRKAGADVS